MTLAPKEGRKIHEEDGEVQPRRQKSEAGVDNLGAPTIDGSADGAVRVRPVGCMGVLMAAMGEFDFCSKGANLVMCRSAN